MHPWAGPRLAVGWSHKEMTAKRCRDGFSSRPPTSELVAIPHTGVEDAQEGANEDWHGPASRRQDQRLKGCFMSAPLRYWSSAADWSSVGGLCTPARGSRKTAERAVGNQQGHERNRIRIRQTASHAKLTPAPTDPNQQQPIDVRNGSKAAATTPSAARQRSRT